MNKFASDFIRQLLSAEEFKEYQSLTRRVAENSRAIPAKVDAGVDLADMLQELTRTLAPRLETAQSASETDRREKNAAEMPWVHKAAPKAVLQDVERLIWYNDRIIAFATEMAAKHTVIAQLLAAQKLAALSVMQRQEQELGKVFTTFVRRLKQANLKTDAVKDLPNGVIEALVALLNGDAGVSAATALGVEAHVRNDEDALAEEHDMLDRQVAALKVELASFTDRRDLQALVGDEPPVPLQPDEWDYAAGPLPPELWSNIDETVEYRFVDRGTKAEESDAVYAMPLPEAHDWQSLQERDADFKSISTGWYAPRSKRGGENNIKDLLGPRLDVEPDKLDANIVRAWLFLLVARHNAVEENDRLFGPRYFEGVLLPLDPRKRERIREICWALGD